LIKLSACPLSRLDGRWTTKEGEALSLPIGKEHSASHKHWEKISVKDTGIGLKKENKQIIFKPFVQMDSSKSRRHQGTGLGLALCKQFVELHKGSIWAESEGEGKGCEFHFVIPV
ncbi:MAG TPA: ATP-binding protein, partial [Smithellaceae bacterium]|nr:ATP-binding protein [Smithellaceae bacterium]